jgi:hypothetical protein
MTDIDDTLYPNNEYGTYIAGSDSSWAQKIPYPGIKLFYKLFYKKLPNNSKYTTILSATPGCIKNNKLIDKYNLLHGILREYGFIQGPLESKRDIFNIDNISNITRNCIGHYCGVNNTDTDVDNISSLFKLFGNTKFERFKQYLSIFPEYKIIFIGDNGQGDVLAGQQMINYIDNCYVFIHKVSEDGVTLKRVPEEENIKNDRLNFFANYYDVALKFRELGIFTDDDAKNIKNSIYVQLKFRNNSQFVNLYSSIGRGKSIKKVRKYKLTRKIKKYAKYQ